MTYEVTLVSGESATVGSASSRSAHVIEVNPGIKGDTGYTGSAGTGYTGSAGAAGYNGSSGAQGNQGLVGVQGAQGSTGVQGAQGVQGAGGSQGAQGSTGQIGNDGYAGSTGYTGSGGPQGHVGYTGSMGEAGYTGSVGEAGSMGPQGQAGSFGGASFDYYYLDTTIDANPGQGYLNFNNADLSLVSEMYIAFGDSEGANNYNYLQTIDDSSSLVKGTFKIENNSNTNNFAYFSITGNHYHHDTYFEVPVAWLSGDYSFANNTQTTVTFVRTGDKGDTGYTGSTGFQGAAGTAGSVGYTGSVGSQGSTGSQGPSGSLGYTGSAGSTGVQGAQGFQGATGSQGPQGWQGAQGLTGYTGSVGSQGPTGSQGPQGYTGSAGSFDQTLNTTSSVTFSNTSVTNVLDIQQTQEKFTSYSSVNGTFNLDCSGGNIFYASSLTGSFTPNFTNFALSNSYATTVTIILNQGSTAYSPTSNVQFNSGSVLTTSWLGASVPVSVANRKEALLYSVLNNGGTYIVLGQLVTFGA